MDIFFRWMSLRIYCNMYACHEISLVLDKRRKELQQLILQKNRKNRAKIKGKTRKIQYFKQHYGDRLK